MSNVMMYRFPKTYKNSVKEKGILKTRISISNNNEDVILTKEFDFVIIDSEMKEAAIKQGWRSSPKEAYELNAGKEDNQPATRAELEAKAKQLGIKFPPNTKDSTLSAKIEEKLKA